MNTNKPSCSRSVPRLFAILRGRAQAAASITGSDSYPDLSGTVRFYQTKEGVRIYG